MAEPLLAQAERGGMAPLSRTAARAQAERFSWPRIARLHLDLYAAVMRQAP